MSNRLRELRLARHLSMREVGDKVGVGASHINKLEKGQIGLTLDWMERLAAALDVRPIDLIWRDPNREPTADLEPLETPPAEIAELLRPAARRAFRVTTRRLDNLGLVPGDVVITAPAETTPEPGGVVVARLDAALLLRQFLPPAQLVSNSAAENLLPIDMRRAAVDVIGVLVASVRLGQPDSGAIFTVYPVDPGA